MNASKRNDRRQARTVGFRSIGLTAPSSELAVAASVDLADDRPFGVHELMPGPRLRRRRCARDVPARRRIGSNGGEYDITIT
jgi:hypothetical protein